MNFTDPTIVLDETKSLVYTGSTVSVLFLDHSGVPVDGVEVLIEIPAGKATSAINTLATWNVNPVDGYSFDNTKDTYIQLRVAYFNDGVSDDIVIFGTIFQATDIGLDPPELVSAAAEDGVARVAVTYDKPVTVSSLLGHSMTGTAITVTGVHSIVGNVVTYTTSAPMSSSETVSFALASSNGVTDTLLNPAVAGSVSVDIAGAATMPQPASLVQFLSGPQQTSDLLNAPYRVDDQSGNANHGTNIETFLPGSGVTLTIAPDPVGVYDMDAAVNSGILAGQLIPTGDFSFGWRLYRLRSADWLAAGCIIAGSQNSNDLMQIKYDGTVRLRFNSVDTNTGYSFPAMAVGDYIDLAFTYNSTTDTGRLYANGVLVATMSSLAPPGVGQNINWGLSNFNNGWRQGMKMISYHSVVLSDAEVAQLSEYFDTL